MGGTIDKRGDPLGLWRRCDGLRIAAELFDHRPGALGKGLEVVTAFQDGSDFSITTFRR